MNRIKVDGDKQLIRSLKELDNKVQKKGARQALRKGAKLVAAADKQDAPEGETHTTQEAIKIQSGKRKKDRISLNVGLSAEQWGGDQNDFYVPFVMFGTKNYTKDQLKTRRHRTGALENENKEWRIFPSRWKEKAFDRIKSEALDTTLLNLRDFIQQNAK